MISTNKHLPVEEKTKIWGTFAKLCKSPQEKTIFASTDLYWWRITLKVHEGGWVYNAHPCPVVGLGSKGEGGDGGDQIRWMFVSHKHPIRCHTAFTMFYSLCSILTVPKHCDCPWLFFAGICSEAQQKLLLFWKARSPLGEMYHKQKDLLTQISPRNGSSSCDQHLGYHTAICPALMNVSPASWWQVPTNIVFPCNHVASRWLHTIYTKFQSSKEV